MRLFAVFAMALLCSGCFVLDELEQGEELMLQASSRGGKKLVDQKAQKDQDALWDERAESLDKGDGMLDNVGETVSRWWDEATAEPPREPGPGDALVRCSLGGNSRFMSLNDCEIRGGSPG